MSISRKRFEQAQKSERLSWEKVGETNLISENKARQYWHYYIDLLKRHTNLKPSDIVLDIGCGPRGLVNYLDQGQKYGLDPLMDFYLSKFDMPRDVKWEKGCGEEIPFEDGFFNVVVTTNALDHTQNPRRLLSEIGRVLKDNGFLFLTVDCYSLWAKRLKSSLERLGVGDTSHPHTFITSEVKELITKVGFNVVSILDGKGDLGIWVRSESTSKAGTGTWKISGNLTRAMEIKRNEGIKKALQKNNSFYDPFSIWSPSLAY